MLKNTGIIELVVAIFVVSFLLCAAFAAIELIDINELLDDVFTPPSGQFSNVATALLVFSAAFIASLVKTSRLVLPGIDACVRPLNVSGSASAQTLIQQFNN